jgi:hypothetical protein
LGPSISTPSNLYVLFTLDKKHPPLGEKLTSQAHGFSSGRMTGGDKTIQRVKAKTASKGVICLTGSS